MCTMALLHFPYRQQRFIQSPMNNIYIFLFYFYADHLITKLNSRNQSGSRSSKGIQDYMVDSWWQE